MLLQMKYFLIDLIACINYRQWSRALFIM